MIFDEGHHVAAKTFKNVAFNLKSQIRMCLSATPERWDGNEGLIYFASGQKCYFIDYPSLVENKIVAALKKFTWIIPRTKNEKKCVEGIEKREKLHRGSWLKHYHQKARIILQARNKLPVILEIVKKHREGKIFIFTKYLSQVAMISRYLEKHHINHRILTGSTSESRRREGFKEFREGKTKS